MEPRPTDLKSQQPTFSEKVSSSLAGAGEKMKAAAEEFGAKITGKSHEQPGVGTTGTSEMYTGQQPGGAARLSAHQGVGAGTGAGYPETTGVAGATGTGLPGYAATTGYPSGTSGGVTDTARHAKADTGEWAKEKMGTGQSYGEAAKEKLHEAGEAIRDTARDAQERMKAGLERTGEKMHEAGMRAEDKAKDVTRGTEPSIPSHMTR